PPPLLRPALSPRRRPWHAPRAAPSPRGSSRAASPCRPLSGSSIAALVLAEGMVLGRGKPARHLRCQLLLSPGHPLIAHRLVLGRVRLRAVSATCPSFTSPAFSHSRSTCANKRDSAPRCRRRNSLTVRKSGGSSATIIRKSVRYRHALAIRR